jgi:NTP pyrophosphatase (non-canonical NTP hydrolase)
MLTKYRKQIDQWFQKKDWSYWPPPIIMLRLGEEIGEVDRAINHIYGNKKKRDDEEKQNLAEEIGDVVYSLCCLANCEKSDLSKIERVVTDVEDPIKVTNKLSVQSGKLVEMVINGSSSRALTLKIADMIALLMELAQATEVDFDAGIQAALDKSKKRDRDRYNP